MFWCQKHREEPIACILWIRPVRKVSCSLKLRTRMQQRKYQVSRIPRILTRAYAYYLPYRRIGTYWAVVSRLEKKREWYLSFDNKLRNVASYAQQFLHRYFLICLTQKWEIKLCHGSRNCNRSQNSRSVSNTEKLMTGAYTACYTQTFQH